MCLPAFIRFLEGGRRGLNMKILYISPRSPYDRQCGGGVRSGFMLKALEGQILCAS